MAPDDVRISGREAADLLAPCGLSLMATQHLLATGIAGRPMVTRGAYLYDRAAVAGLASARDVDNHEFTDDCPHGYLVVRLPRQATYDVAGDWDERERVLRGPWRIGRRTIIVIAARMYQRKHFPLVLTASGFVVGGAEVVGIAGGGDVDPGRTVVFDIAPPGAWLSNFIGRRCALGRGPQMMLRGWGDGLSP